MKDTIGEYGIIYDMDYKIEENSGHLFMDRLVKLCMIIKLN